MIAAHPDDETLFNLGRFAERGWPMGVALVTNGESGSVVQSIRPHYDPKRDPDVLIEKQPGLDAWLTVPPSGPRLRVIASPTALAKERRREFLQSLSVHRVSTVFFLSTVRDPTYDDNWDEGIRNWNKPALRKALIAAVKDFRPDLIVTLNPAETWAHPQHVGLGRLVAKWRSAGRFDRPQRPALYGLREHAWYPESIPRQPGDLTFSRATHSNVLGSTYERYWRKATSAYISQSSHPVWLDARAAVGILPGYRGIDVLRRIDRTKGKSGLKAQFSEFPPNRQAYQELPRRPVVVKNKG